MRERKLFVLPELTSLAQMMRDDPTWAQRGACVGLDPALFFPERGESNNQARATCAACEVRVECATWGVYNERQGIWGGLSSRDMRRTRKALGISLADSEAAATTSAMSRVRQISA